MRFRTMAVALLLCLPAARPADAQMFSARRMAMGGVVLGGGVGCEAVNVAYRAVPDLPGHEAGVSLPLGLIPVLADPPTFDTKNPDFNAFELASLLLNPPWNLTLVGPKPPSNDVTIDVAQNRLAVDLGDVGKVFPKDHARLGSSTSGPAFGVGARGFFVAAAPLVEYDNDLTLNDALRGALRDADAFRPRTEYVIYDHGRAQAAAGLHLGYARALAVRGEPGRGGSGFYAGARVKLLRGLAYGDADNTAAFITSDTLFSESPVDIRYTGHYRDAGPDVGGFGRGLDLGSVWVGGPLEVGLGVNDIGTRIDWKVRETTASRDSVTGDYVQTILSDARPFTSEVPVTWVANAAWHAGPWLVAGDLVRGVNTTQLHAGVERWVGRVALRAGTGLDANQLWEVSGGVGWWIGRYGLDLALATNSRTPTQERALELSAGLVFYH